MIKRSNTGAVTVLKNMARVAPHPWIGAKLVKLQLEKQFFNFLYPEYSSGKANKIRQASFRITDICNLRCHTCGQWGGSGFLHGRDLKELKRAEVSPDRYLELFQDLAQNGHRPITYFWGGEPMLYDGILDVIEGAAKLRMPPAIATNGTRLTQAAERLVEAPLFLLQVSIDGHTAEIHNQARPSAGSGNNFADIAAGLETVNRVRRERGRRLPLIASLTVVHRTNYRNLTDIYQAWRDKVDMFVFYLSWWIDEDRADAHDEDFSRRFGFVPKKHRGWVGNWRPDDYQALQAQLEALRRLSRGRGAPSVSLIPSVWGEDDLRTYYNNHGATFGFDQCISIYQAVEVNSNGDVSPCRDYHDFVVGNVKDCTLTQLWNSPAYRRFRRSLTCDGLMPVCSRCCGLMGY